MQTPDVIEGRCACGVCVAEEDGDLHKLVWVFAIARDILFVRSWGKYVIEGEPLPEEVLVRVRSCPVCHYRLDADGKARRMLDWTVGGLRTRIADLRGNRNMTQASHDEEREFAAVELERVLPEED